MTFPYLARLVCLCLASFFLIHLVLGLITSVAAPLAIRNAERMKPRSAAVFLLGLRLFPPTGALFVVVALCVPSYVRFEPQAIAEPVGLICIAAAFSGLAVIATSILRGLKTSAASLAFIRNRRNGAIKMKAFWLVQAPTPSFALAGILRPELFVSSDVLSQLSAEQLRVALRHEDAHQVSYDNFKRLLVIFAPGMLPRFSGFTALEHAWARFAEWAADDSAVAGNSQRSLALAEALVRIARVNSARQLSPLITSLVSDGEDLSARIERLLNNNSPRRAACNPASTGAIAALAAITIGFALRGITLASVHETLEHLIR
jgi:Zn-dependent protease with chaperone function